MMNNAREARLNYWYKFFIANDGAAIANPVSWMDNKNWDELAMPAAAVLAFINSLKVDDSVHLNQKFFLEKMRKEVLLQKGL
jgi:hypothetical protein